jgi:hypothetical protein
VSIVVVNTYFWMKELLEYFSSIVKYTDKKWLIDVKDVNLFHDYLQSAPVSVDILIFLYNEDINMYRPFFCFRSE